MAKLNDHKTNIEVDNLPSISLESISVTKSTIETNRLNSCRCSKIFILIFIFAILIVIILVPILTRKKSTKNNLTTRKPPLTTRITTEMIPVYNINFTNTMKWKQHGITVLADDFSLHDTMDIDDDDNIYICKYEENLVLEWNNRMINSRIIAGGNGNGNETNQLSNPTDILVDRKNHSIFICDQGNNRIMRWSLFQNATDGYITIYDIHCAGLAFDDEGYLYVSDTSKHEVRRWNIETYENTLVSGGTGAGDDAQRLFQPKFIHIDKDYSVYVSDFGNDRVMKWKKNAKQGILVAGGFGQGSSLLQIREPKGIIVDHRGNLYISDSDNNRLMRWINGSSKGTIIVGGHGIGNKSNQINRPVDFVFDKYGHLYVLNTVDITRLQKFFLLSN